MVCDLTEEQEATVNDVVSSIAKLNCKNEDLSAEAERFSESDWKSYCVSGILKLSVPKELGGRGEPLHVTVEAIRKIARHTDNEGTLFSLCAHLSTCMIPILNFGSQLQKETWIPKLASGEAIGGNASTETNAGSDLWAMSSTVTPVNEGYELSGSKNFATNGSVADCIIVYARHLHGIKYADASALIVSPKDIEGFSVIKDWSKMGLSASPLSELKFEKSFLPEAALLGRERRGVSIFEDSMLWERIIMSAYLLGSMERQFNIALAHCQSRKQHGSKLVDFQAVGFRLVDMHMILECSAALLSRTYAKIKSGQICAADASLLKLYVSEGRVQNSINAMSLFGGYGYMKDYPIEKQMRDSLAAPIYSGTSDVQKHIIASDLKGY
jgi:hypothetical protein